jgi:serine/threonine-protein kinase RsbW
MKEETIFLTNQITQLDVLTGALESIAEKWDISPALTLNLNLVLEELVTNIIFYGFTDTNEHTITIRLSLENTNLTVIITDDAIAFNPLQAAEPDINQALEERAIGGLGIHLVRKIMDDVHYERLDEKNILTLKKSIA